ncbi:MAG: efflux RND transporter periplasmic adaptor subunit [Acidobacteriota bacterium]
MKRLAWISGFAVIAFATYFWFSGGRGEDTSAYRLVDVERGDVESVVSATGTLEALTTVEVGTQISGRIAELYADFNDRVTAGELIARLDPTLLEQTAREAEATLLRVRAEHTRSERDLRRVETLHADGLISDSELDTARYEFEATGAAVTSSEASLARARQNLEYANIYSPIDGVVVERAVDVGQTVAASLSAPRLYLIAEDLEQMEILTAVDESDIGKIHEGQQARFNVQAFPEETFLGQVRQVRLQSVTQENVVTYTVVIDVANPEGKLLPGMTATVEFVVAAVTDVLKVLNAALRFRPTEEMVAALRERRQQRGETGPPAGSGRGFAGAGQRSPEHTVLWALAEDGKPFPVPVRVGLSDGQFTEVFGEGLSEGMQLIVGVTASAGEEAASPFGAGQNTRRRGPPGGF